jgi:hypothetical protein
MAVTIINPVLIKIFFCKEKVIIFSKNLVNFLFGEMGFGEAHSGENRLFSSRKSIKYKVKKM